MTNITSFPDFQNVTSLNPNLLPEEFRVLSENSRITIIAYTIFFIVGATGNLTVFLLVCRQLGKLKWRITILIVHLSIADLIVTFILIPSEIFWKLTIGWYGGNILCKITQYGRVFGLYLSSMIIICISFDRFFAILYPLKMGSATVRVKGMLGFAWIASAIFSVPQLFVFRVSSHPTYTNFEQCVASSFLTPGSQLEVYYNVFHVSALYFIPLLVIVYTYSMILWKITQKSREHQKAKQENSNKEIYGTVVTSSQTSNRNRLLLRSTDSAAMMARAKCRTLKMTVIIVMTFIFCWSPYVVMNMWYMFSRDSASKLDAKIQNAFFMMAVANSCVNPIIYGNYARETQGTTMCFTWKRNGSAGSQRRPTDQLPITSVI